MKPETAMQYEKLAAPREDHSALVQPSVEVLAKQLAGGDRWLRSAETSDRGGEIEFCGKPLGVVRELARRETVELAAAYTAQYIDDKPLTAEYDLASPIVMGGHQPELFHPGVWFKNFLLSDVGQRTGGIAINFLVDNDVCRTTSIRVPTLTNAGNRTPSYAVQAVPFDSPMAAIPWELRQVADDALWQSFATRVAEILPTSEEPILLEQLWPTAIDAAKGGKPIGAALAEARHSLEHRSGLRTLEVPLSQIAKTRSFSRFCIQLLSQLPRFQAVYNEQLLAYRSAHRIRNHAHPVPALEQAEGWVEAPLWVYRRDAPTRQRLWVKTQDSQLLLSDRAGWETVISGRLDCDNAATQWMALGDQGVCLRPRALLTTMFMRLLVSDLFVHGIGGAKYDQLTDSIIQDFFGIDPPQVCVASATLQLPLELPSSPQGDSISQQKQRLWRLRHNADTEASLGGPEFESLLRRKQELLANIPAKGDKWQWHVDLTNVKRQLADLVTDDADEASRRMDEIAAATRQSKIAHAREYSFCLFPLGLIRDALTQLVQS